MKNDVKRGTRDACGRKNGRSLARWAAVAAVAAGAWLGCAREAKAAWGDETYWKGNTTYTNWNADAWYNGTQGWDNHNPNYEGGRKLLFDNDNKPDMGNNFSGNPGTNRWQIIFDAACTATRTIRGTTVNHFFDNGGTMPKIENYSAVEQRIWFPISIGYGSGMEVNPVNGDLSLTNVSAWGHAMNVFGNGGHKVVINGIWYAGQGTGNTLASTLYVDDASEVYVKEMRAAGFTSSSSWKTQTINVNKTSGRVVVSNIYLGGAANFSKQGAGPMFIGGNSTQYGSSVGGFHVTAGSLVMSNLVSVTTRITVTNLALTNSATVVMHSPAKFRRVYLSEGSTVEMDVFDNSTAAKLGVDENQTALSGDGNAMNISYSGQHTTLKLRLTSGFDPTQSGSFIVYEGRNSANCMQGESANITLQTVDLVGGRTLGTFALREGKNSKNSANNSAIWVDYTKPATAPELSKPTATVTGTTTATLGATVDRNNGLSITDYGIVYSKTATEPTVGGTGCTKAQKGTTTPTSGAAWTLNVTGLEAGTTYYYRGYATSSAGTGYSTVGTFTTLANQSTAVSVTVLTHTYNGNSITLVGTGGNGTGTAVYTFGTTLKTGTTGTGSLTSAGVLTVTAAGDFVFDVTRAASTGYAARTDEVTVTVNKGTQSISGLSDVEKTYGDGTFSLSATSSAGLTVSYSISPSSVATVSGSTVTIAGAGSATITASQAGNGLWNAAANATATLTVNKKNPTVTASVSPATIRVGGTATLTGTTDSGATLTYGTSSSSIASLSGTTVTGAGYGTATLTVNSPATANYNAGSATCTITVLLVKPTASDTITGVQDKSTTTIRVNFSQPTGHGNGTLLLIRQGSAITATPTDGSGVGSVGCNSSTAGNWNGTSFDSTAPATYAIVNSVAGTRTYKKLKSLVPAAHYYLQAYSYNLDGSVGAGNHSYAYGPAGGTYDFWMLATEPSAQASGLTAGTVGSRKASMTWTAGSWTAASGETAALKTLLIAVPSGSSVTAPTDGVAYSAGDAIGAGTVAFAGAGTSAEVTGLTPEQTYTIYAYAYAEGGDGTTANYLTSSPASRSITTIASQGPAVQATGVDTMGYLLNWSQLADDSAGYDVDTRASGGSWASAGRGLPGYNKPVTGLTSGSTYEARVRKSPDGDWSDELSVKAGVKPNTVSSTATRNSVTFTWTDVQSGAVGYGVQVTKTAAASSLYTKTCPSSALGRNSFSSGQQWKYTGDQITCTSTSFNTSPGYRSGYGHIIIGTGQTLESDAFALDGMTALQLKFTLAGHNSDSGTDNYRVEAYYQVDGGVWNWLGSANTFAAHTLTVPQGAIDEASTIAFKLVAPNAHVASGGGFFICPAIDSISVKATAKGAGDYDSPVTETTTTAKSYTVSGLTANETVYFRVQALQGSTANPTAKSVWVEATGTATAYTAPGTPVLSAVTRNGMTATWTAGDTTDLDHYEVQWSTVSSFSTTAGSANVAPGTLTKAISGLTASTTYYVRVRAVGTDSQYSAWSGTANATTSGFAGPEVTVGGETRNSMTLSWAAVSGAASYVVQYTTCPSGGGSDTLVSTCPNGTTSNRNLLATSPQAGAWSWQRPSGELWPEWDNGYGNFSVLGHNLMSSVAYGSTPSPKPALVSPILDLSGYTGGYVSFSHGSRHNGYKDPYSKVTLYWCYSTDGGTTWTSWTAAGTSGAASGATWTSGVTLEIPSAATGGGKTKVRLKLQADSAATEEYNSKNVFTGPMLKDVAVYGTGTTGDYSAGCSTKSAEIPVAGTSYTMEGLSAETTYYFRVLAVGSGDGARSSWTEGQGTTTAFEGPAGAAVTGTTRYTLTAGWDEYTESGYTTTYKVQLTGCANAGADETAVATCPASTLDAGSSASAWTYQRSYSGSTAGAYPKYESSVHKLWGQWGTVTKQPGILSPVLDLGSYASASVEFTHLYVNKSEWSEVKVSYSLDGGETWSDFDGGTTGVAAGYTLATGSSRKIALPAAAMTDGVKIRVQTTQAHAYSPNGTWETGDILVAGASIVGLKVTARGYGGGDFDTAGCASDVYTTSSTGLTFDGTLLAGDSHVTGLEAGHHYYVRVATVLTKSGESPAQSAWSEADGTTLEPMPPPEEVWAENVRQAHLTVAWSEAPGADVDTLYKYEVSSCPGGTETVVAAAEARTDGDLDAEVDDWSYVGGGSEPEEGQQTAFEFLRETYPAWAKKTENSIALAGTGEPGIESAEFSTVGASAGSITFLHGRWYSGSSIGMAAVTASYSIDGGDSWTEIGVTPTSDINDGDCDFERSFPLPTGSLGHAHVKVRLEAKSAGILQLAKSSSDSTLVDKPVGAAVKKAKVTLTKQGGDYTDGLCVVKSGSGLTAEQLSVELGDSEALAAGTTYYFRVAASDGKTSPAQYGAWVESSAKTPAVPDRPGSAWVVPTSIGRHSMTVQWEAVAEAESYVLKVYDGSSAGGTLLQTIETTATTVPVSGLATPDHDYYFTVQSVADGCSSAMTRDTTGHTSTALAVTGFCVTNILDTSLTVKWDEVAHTAYTLEAGPMTTNGATGALYETIECPATTLARSDKGNGWFYLGGNANYPKYYANSDSDKRVEDQGHVLSYSSAGTPGIQSRWFSTFGAKSATVEFLHGRWFNDGNNSALQVFYSIDGGTTWASAGDIPATGNAVPGGTSGGEKTVTRLALPARALGQRTVAIRVMAPKATSGGSYGYGAEIKDLTVKIEAYPQSASTFSGAVSGGSKALTGLTAGTRYWFRLTATETGVAESATAIQAAATRTKTKGVVQSQGFEGTSANGALDTTGWEYSIKYIPVQNGSAAAHTTRASGDPEVVVVDGENPLYGDRALRMSGSAAASVYGVVEFADKNFGSAQNVAVTIPFAVRDLASGENLWVCYSTDNGSTWSAPAGLETLVKSGMTLGKIARGGSDTINQNWPYNHGVNETTRPGGDAYTFEVRGATRIAVRVAFCGNAGGAKHYCYVDEVKLERLATPPSAVSATANAQGSVNLGWTPAGGQSVVIIRGQDQRNPPASVDLGSLPHGYEVVTNATGGTYWVNTADPASATTGVDSQVTGGWKYFYYFYGALANGDGTYTLSKECVSAEAIVKGMVEAIASQGWDGWDVHPWGYKKGRTTNPGQAGDCGYWAYNQSGATLPYKWAHFEEDSWEYDGDARGNQGAHDYAYYYGAGKTYGPAGRTDPDSTQQLGVSSYTNYFGTNCFRLSGGSGWIWSGTHTYTNNNNNVRTVTNPYINTNNAAIQFDTVDLSGYKNVQFSFHYAQTYSGGGNYMHVAISTNGNGENGSWLAYDNKNAAGWRQVDSSRDYGLQLQTMTEEQTGGNVDFYDESRAPYGNPFVLNVPDSVTQMTVRLTFFDTTGHDQRNALVFVDEVRLTGEVAIEAPKPYISEIGKDRFMVHWAPVTDATSYDVQVTEVCDESVIKLAQAFPVNALPKDWTKSDTGVNFPKTASRLYSGATGDHDHGLSLTGQGGWLTSPEVGGSTNLHFWAKANNGSGSSKLIVQAKGADEPESAWETLLTKTCAQLTATWTEYELALPNRQWTQVRFMRSTDGTGDIYVDDVEFHGEGVYTGTLKLNATGVSATNQVVTGLESGHRYLAHVRAVGAPAGVVVRSAWGETADWTSGDFKVVPDGFEMTRSTWAAASGGMVVIAVDKGTAPSAVKAPEGSKTAASFTPGSAYTDNGSTGAHVMWAGTAGQSSPGREYVSPYDGEHPAQDFVVYWKRGNYWEGRLETNVVLGTYICSAADALAYTNGVAVAGSAAVDSDTAYAGGKGWTGPWKLSVRHGESWNNAIIDKNSSGAEGLIETNQIQGAGGNMIKLMPGGSANSKQVALKRQLAADLSAGSDWWGMFTMKVSHPHDHSWAGIRLLGAGSAEQASVGNVWNNNSSSQSAAGISDTASSYEISAGGTYIYVFKWDAGQKKMYLHVQYVSGTSSPVWDPSVAATLTLPNSWTWDVNGKSITGMTDIRYIELVAQNNNGSDEYVGDVWFDEIRIGESWADIIGKETEAPFPVTSATAWTDGNELVRVSWTYADAGHDSTANVDRPLADGVRILAREGTSGEWTEIYKGKGTNEAAVAAGGVSRWDHVVAPGSVHQYQVVAYASGKSAAAVDAALKGSSPATYSVETGLYGAEEYVNPFAYTNWAVASTAAGSRWLGGNGFGENYWSPGSGSAGTWSIATPEEAQGAAHITNAVTGARLAAGNVLKVVVGNGETASIDRTLSGDAWCGKGGETFYVAFRMAYQWGDQGGRQVGLRLTDDGGKYVQFGKARGDDSGYQHRFGVTASPNGTGYTSGWSTSGDDMLDYGNNGANNAYLVVGKVNWSSDGKANLRGVKYLIGNNGSLATLPGEEKDVTWEASYDNAGIGAIRKIELIAGTENSGYGTVGTAWFDEIRFGTSWEDIVGATEPEDVWVDGISETAYLGDFARWYMYGWPKGPKQSAWVSLATSTAFTTVLATNDTEWVDNEADRGKERTKWQGKEIQFTQTGTLYGGGSVKGELVTANSWTRTAASDHKWNTYTVNPLPVPTVDSAVGGTAKVSLRWTPATESGRTFTEVMVVRYTGETVPAPVQGTTYLKGQAFGGGTVVYRGTATSFEDKGLTKSTTYKYAFFTVNNSYYSTPATASATTDANDPEIEIDGDPGDWVGLPSEVKNSSTLSSGEWIWTDKVLDGRVDKNGAYDADITEFRMKVDNNGYVNFMARLHCLTNKQNPYIAVGIVTNVDATQLAATGNEDGEDWIGDESATFMGGNLFDPASLHYADIQMAVHWVTTAGENGAASGSGAWVVELYKKDGNSWFAPVLAWEAASSANGAEDPCIEWKVKRSDLGLDYATLTPARFTVASFANAGGWNNDTEATIDLSSGKSHAVDALCIAPWGVNDKDLALSAWDEGIQKGTADYWFDIWFGPTSLHNAAPNAPASYTLDGAPAVNGQKVSASPTMRWSACADHSDVSGGGDLGFVVGYLVEVSTNEYFNGLEGTTENGPISCRVNVQSVPGAAMMSYRFKTDSRYYWWRVRARDNSGALSAPTPWHYEVEGKTDNEGPVARLLFVGKDEDVARYVSDSAFRHEVDLSGDATSVLDSDLEDGGHKFGFVLEWYDVNGVFATNWFRASKDGEGSQWPIGTGKNPYNPSANYNPSVGDFAWSIQSHHGDGTPYGRVSPNWDLVIVDRSTVSHEAPATTPAKPADELVGGVAKSYTWTNAMVLPTDDGGTETIWGWVIDCGLDHVFQPTQTINDGNDGQYITNHVQGAFSIGTYRTDLDIYLTVSAEDGCRTGPYAETADYDWPLTADNGSTGSYQANNSPSFQVSGWCAAAPNPSRNVTTNQLLHIHVRDNDVTPPVTSQAKWRGEATSAAGTPLLPAMAVAITNSGVAKPASWTATWSQLETVGRVPAHEGQGKALQWQLTDGDVATYTHPATAGGTGTTAWQGSAKKLRLFFNVYDEYLHSGLASFSSYDADAPASGTLAAVETGSYTSKADKTRTLNNTGLLLGEDTNWAGFQPTWSSVTQYPWDDEGTNEHGAGTGLDSVLAWQFDATEANLEALLGQDELLSNARIGVVGGEQQVVTNAVKLFAWDSDNNAVGDQEGAELEFGQLAFTDDDATPPEMASFTSLGTGTNFTWFGRLGEWHFGESSAAPVFTTNSRMPAIQLSQEVTLHQYNTSGDPTRHWNQDSHVIYYNGGGGPSDDWNQTGAPYFEFTLHGSNGITWSADMIGFENRIAQAGPTQYALTVQAPTLSLVNESVLGGTTFNTAGGWTTTGDPAVNTTQGGTYKGMITFTGGTSGEVLSPVLPVADYTTFVVSARVAAYGSSGSGAKPDRTLKFEYKATGDSGWTPLPDGTFVARNFSGTGPANGQDFTCELKDAVPGLLGSAKSVQIRAVFDGGTASYTFALKDFKLTYGSGDGREHLLGRMEIEKEMDEGGEHFKSETVTSVIFAFDTPIQCKKADNHIFRLYAFDATRYNAAGELERLVDVLPADRWTFTWGIRELFIHGTASEPKKSEVTDYDVAEGAWTNRLEALDGAMAGYDTERSGLRVFDAVDGSGTRTEYSGEAPSFRILYPQAYSTSPQGEASGGELILRSVSAAAFNHLDDPEFDAGTPWTLSASGAAVSGGKLTLAEGASGWAKQTVALDAMSGVKSATVSGTVRAKGTVGGVNKLTVTAKVYSKANALMTTLTEDIVTTSRAKNYSVGPWALDYDNVGSVEFTVGQTDATATALVVESLAGYVAQWGADITDADAAWATAVTNGMEAAKVLVRTPELDLTHTAMPLSSNLTGTTAQRLYTLEATLHDYDRDRAGDALATTATTNFWLWDDDDVAPQWGEKFVSPMGIFVNGKIVSLKARRESGANHVWPILDADLTALDPAAEVLFSLSAYDYSGWKTTSFTIGSETVQSGDEVAAAAAAAGWTQAAAAGAADSPAATNTWSIGAKNLYTSHRDAFVTGGLAGETLEMKAAAIDLDNDRQDDSLAKSLSRIGYVWFADQDVSAPGWGAQTTPYEMLMISAGVPAGAGLSDLVGTAAAPAAPYALGGAANNQGAFSGRTYTVYDGQMKEYGAAGANQFVVTANLNDPLPTGEGARARHPTGLQRGGALTETRAMWGDAGDPANVFTVTNTHLVLETARTGGEGSLTNVAYSEAFTDPAIGKTRINTQAGHTSWAWTFTTNDIGSLLPAGETSAALTLKVEAYDADANRHEDQMHATLAGPAITLRDDDTASPTTPAIDFDASSGLAAGDATRETAAWTNDASAFRLVFTEAEDGTPAAGDLAASGIASHRMASTWSDATAMAEAGSELSTSPVGDSGKVSATLGGSDMDQGLETHYLYAVDADDDRGGDALASATPATFRTAYDCTPPTKVGYYVDHRVEADTDDVDDPTSQFDVSWPGRTLNAAGTEVDVGPDDDGHAKYPAGKSGTDVLSPWASYKVYYGTYNPLDVPADDDVASSTKCFVYTNFIATGAYQEWEYVCATNVAEDPLATATNYVGLSRAATTKVRLFDLDFDEDYVIIVTGIDKAGNEGPADLYSWATNNTIRFALTQGVMRARSDVIDAFGNNHNMRAGDEFTAAMYWKAAGPADASGGVRVTKEYDLIYRDGANFDENPELGWTKVATVQSNWFTDASGFGNRRGQMRFYRASYKDRWQRQVSGHEQRPLVSEEVYSMDNVVLSEGVNNVSLQGVPYTNTFAGVFGTDAVVWPVGTTAAESVQVRFYSQTQGGSGPKVELSEGYYLTPAGKWLSDGGADVTDVLQDEAFFKRPFAIILPEPLPTQYVTTNAVNRDLTNAPLDAMVWHPLMQVPTNGTFRASVTCGAGLNGVRYSPVSLNLPVTAGPGGLGLPIAGTRKVVETVSDPWTQISLVEANEKYPGAVHNLGDTIAEPGFVPGKTSGDRLYVLDTETKAARSGSTVYCTTNGVWKFVASDAEVPGNFIKPNDMIVIISRNAGTGTNTTWTWSYDPTNYYRLPTRHMGLESSN